MQTQGREEKDRVVIGGNDPDKWSKMVIKHCPRAPRDAPPSRRRFFAELTLLVKSSSTKVATLPLIPMKRFTLVRTT